MARHNKKTYGATMPTIAEFVAMCPVLGKTRGLGHFQPTATLNATHVQSVGAYPEEQHFAHVLRQNGFMVWYEPICFDLEQKRRGTKRRFAPDFFLPELGMVVEICTHRHEKNRKVRLMAENWPDLAVVVLTIEQVEGLTRRAEKAKGEPLARYLQRNFQTQRKRLKTKKSGRVYFQQ